MGTTTKGFPFPDPGDPFANVDAYIRQLAEALDFKKYREGVADYVSVTVNNSATGTLAVALPAGVFSGDAPSISLTVQGNSNYVACISDGPTTSGFGITVRHIAGTVASTSILVHFQAWQREDV